MSDQTWAQQTPAVQTMVRQAFGRVAAPRRKRASKSKKAKRARASGAKRRANGSGGRKKKAARLVKGSAAAKRYMAKIRRKRK